MEDSSKKSKNKKKETEKSKKETKIYNEDDENELPDIIPAEKMPPPGTPIPKLEIENPKKPENKKPPDLSKLLSNKV